MSEVDRVAPGGVDAATVEAVICGDDPDAHALAAKLAMRPVWTGQGLRIHLPCEYCFALAARVFPSVGPMELLQRTEDLMSVAGLTAFVAGVASFLAGADAATAAAIVFASTVAAGSFVTVGYFRPLGGWWIVLPLARAYGLIGGWGLLHGIVMATGWWRCGWVGAVAFIGARLAAGAVNLGVAQAANRAVFRRTGLPTTSVERAFLLAYMIEATRRGVTTSLDLAAGESEPSRWGPVLANLARQWPVVVERIDAGKWIPDRHV